MSSASYVLLQFLQFRAADYSFLGLQYCRLCMWRCSFAAVSLQFCAADYSFLSLQHRRLRMWRCSFAAVSFMLSGATIYMCGATVYSFLSLQYSITYRFSATVYMGGATVYSFLSLQYRVPYSFLLYFVSTVVCNIACSIAFSSGTGVVICGMAAVAVCGALSVHGVSVLWICSLWEGVCSAVLVFDNFAVSLASVFHLHTSLSSSTLVGMVWRPLRNCCGVWFPCSHCMSRGGVYDGCDS